MIDLSFEVDRAEIVPDALTPLLAFKLRIQTANPEQAVQAVALCCQFQVEVTRRRYNAQERYKLRELLGDPGRWADVQTMVWTHAGTVVPAFSGSTEVDLQVPCTFDFNVAATKYFYGLDEGEAPLRVLFTGSSFYKDDQGELQSSPIAPGSEAQFHLPIKTWKQMMDAYYPNSAWVCVSRDVFDGLCRYKARSGTSTWDETLKRVLAAWNGWVRYERG